MQSKDAVNSDDYKERFKTEYSQLLIRYKKLKQMLRKWDAGTLEFVPTCPRSIYDLQIRAMYDYLAILEARAVMENIALPTDVATKPLPSNI